MFYKHGNTLTLPYKKKTAYCLIRAVIDNGMGSHIRKIETLSNF